MGLVSRFLSDRRGGIAISFGLLVIPVMGVAGAAVDFTRAMSLKAELQRSADATALQIARDSLLGRTHDTRTVFDGYLVRATPFENLDVGGGLVDANTAEVSARADIRMTVASLFVPTLEVGVTATASASRAAPELDEVERDAPTRYRIESASLSFEAADYNELRAYCYHEALNARRPVLQPARGVDPEKVRLERGDLIRAPDFLTIADNANGGRRNVSAEVYCDTGEQLSYQLVNIRQARTDPLKRATNDRYDHFTDTTMRDGVASYNPAQREMLETILCTTREACDPTNPDAVVPRNEQRDRTPAVNTAVCRPGQFMYFGWEDRPPFMGWTDRDYDDIRVVTTCGEGLPVRETEMVEGAPGDLVVRLVR